MSLLLPSFSPHVFAEDEDISDIPEPIISEADIEEMENGENKPSYGERFATSLLLAPVNFIIKIFGARDISFLVFQREEYAKILGSGNDAEGDFGVARDTLIFGIFPETYFNGVAIFYDGLERLFPIPLLALMVLAGFMLLLYSPSVEHRFMIKHYVLGTVLAIVCMRFGAQLWKLILDINYFIVDFVWVMLTDNGVYVGLFLNTIWGTGIGYDIIDVQGLGLGLLVIVAFFMTFILNYQYVMRMIYLSVLIIIFPIVSLVMIFPTRREAMNLWFHEFISNVFLQTGHAIALGLFFYIRHAVDSADIMFWVLVAFMIGLTAVSSLVQRIIGAATGVQVRGGVLGNAGAAMGMMSIMNIARMLKTASGGREQSFRSPEGGNAASNNGAGPGGQGQTPSGSLQMNNQSGVGAPFSNGAAFTRRSAQAGYRSAANNSSTQQSSGHHSRGRGAAEAVNQLARLGVAGGAVAAGGALTGMATGNPALGIMAGTSVGSSVLSGKKAGTVPSDAANQTGEVIKDLPASHPSHLSNDMQAFAAQPEEVGAPVDLRDENSVPPVPYVYNEQTTQAALQKANQSVEAMEQQIQSLGADTTSGVQGIDNGSGNTQVAKTNETSSGVPNGASVNGPMVSSPQNVAKANQQQLSQAGLNQAKTTQQLASTIASPEAKTKQFNTPTKAIQHTAQATQNYQQAQQVLSQIDPKANPEMYANQKKVVDAARSVMNESHSITKTQHPVLNDPSIQGDIANYASALHGGNSNEIVQHRTVVNQKVEELLDDKRMEALQMNRNGRGSL